MYGNMVQPLTPTQQTYSDTVIQNPYTGYAIGGRIGYQKAGPVNPVTPGTLPTVKSPYPVFGKEQALESMYGKESIQNAYQKEVDRYKKDILGIQGQMGMLSQDPDSGVFLPGAEENMSKTEQGLAKLLSPEGKKAFETKKLEEFNRIRKQEGLTSLVPPEENKVEGSEGNGNKNPEFDETKKTNPASKIREEADMLKGLLKDEGLTTAENALIIARALAVPGGIGAKIAAAGELAMPVIKERAKIDREAVLKAYETNKEIKKAEIAAGTLSAQQKLIESEIQNQKSLSKKITRDPDGTVRYDGLTEAEIRDRVQAPIFGRYTSKEAFEKEQRVIKLEKDILAESIKQKPDLTQIQKWKDETEILRKYYKFKANGGRINKAAGGMSMEDTTVEDTTGEKTETVVDTNVDGFPMKPVQKLSFEEIRSRLPKEITDDIVRLISNSSEALQDFAYIKTQQDVNQFNVKYGVNLVLPQNI
jgi:hypothetical protein